MLIQTAFQLFNSKNRIFNKLTVNNTYIWGTAKHDQYPTRARRLLRESSSGRGDRTRPIPRENRPEAIARYSPVLPRSSRSEVILAGDGAV